MAGSSFDDNTIMGTSRVAGFARKNFTSVKPSTSGITRSCRITVGRTVLAVASACVGSLQWWNSMSDSAASIRRTASPMIAWSSTSRTVMRCCVSPDGVAVGVVAGEVS